MNLFGILLFAFFPSWIFYKRYKAGTDLSRFDKSSDRVAPLVSPLLLPIFITGAVVLFIISGGISDAAELIGKIFAMLIFYISVYFAVLLCILPLLRRFISAAACATLWLLPNLLYFTIYFGNPEVSPILVITLPRQWLSTIALVWVIGFAFVLLWYMVSHLRYRRFLLRDAVLVNDPHILAQLVCERERRRMKRSIPILVSKNTATPVSIGCFSFTLRLVLPQKNYSQEEIALIFEHELQHIQKGDINTKVFLAFCTAMCWFNPLMWIARGKVSDDLELSCDEAVLYCAGDATRQRYAKLLLDTAGSSRGYTTCLSATAASFRYRLKNIIKPRERFTGTVIIFFVIFALFLGSGSFALADSGGTVETLIFDKAPPENTIDRIGINNWSDEKPGNSGVYGWDENVLTEYISSLHIKQVYVGGYSNRNMRGLYVDYAIKVENEIISLTRIELCDGILRADLPNDDYGELVYIIKDEIDWGYIESLLDFDATIPASAPQPPKMTVHFNYSINRICIMRASRTILSIESGGEEREVNDILNDADVVEINGSSLTQVRLNFSYRPQGAYQIQVEDWERTTSYFVNGSDLVEGYLQLAPYSAHYTVYGNFRSVRATTYEVKFSFDIKLPDEA